MSIVEPSFTNSGVNMFGPFLIKEGRKELKRYGILFTYLSGRAVHIECACSLETDSFIQALHCFVAQRRGNIRVSCSNNGSNFVGAQKELEKAYKEMDYQKTEFFLQNIGADYINWHRTPLPASSHMGGVWERQIQSACTILMSLLHTQRRSLNDESLRTLMAETEAIVNSRPWRVDTFCFFSILMLKMADAEFVNRISDILYLLIS